MIIKKIFNNNSILALDSDKREVVVMGCGIGFKKDVGDTIDLGNVEKLLFLKKKKLQKNLR